MFGSGSPRIRRSEVKEDWTVLVSRKKHLKKYMQKMQSGFLEGSERDGFYTKEVRYVRIKNLR